MRVVRSVKWCEVNGHTFLSGISAAMLDGLTQGVIIAGVLILIVIVALLIDAWTRV